MSVERETISTKSITVRVDLNDASLISGNNFFVMQGSHNYKIWINISNMGVALDEGYYDMKLYLVTTDNLDFKQSVKEISSRTTWIGQSHPSGGTAVSYLILSDEETADLFTNKGHCQFIIYLGDKVTPAVDFYVTDNPAYIFQQ